VGVEAASAGSVATAVAVVAVLRAVRVRCGEIITASTLLLRATGRYPAIARDAIEFPYDPHDLHDPHNLQGLRDLQGLHDPRDLRDPGHDPGLGVRVTSASASGSGGGQPGQPPRRLPDLHALELLVAVAQTGSLGRAAARLGISQPTASSRMRTLEKRLGLPLLQRATTGSQLTAAGVLVTDWANQVLEQADVLAEGIAALKSQLQGDLRIAASLTLAEHLLPGWLMAMRTHYPQVHVGLRVANSRMVVQALRQGEVELGFIEGPWTPADLQTLPVARDRLVVVTAPDHPWTRRRRAVSGEELAATQLLLREAGSGTRETLERALRPWDGPSVPLLELGSTAPLRSAAAGGAAPAVLSDLAVREDLAAGRLVEIPVDEGLDLSRILRAVWPLATELPEAAKHLLWIAQGGPAGGR
jgi:molybdate transport repressor ModE-like protein